MKEQSCLNLQVSLSLKIIKKTKLDFFTTTDMNFAYNPNQWQYIYSLNLGLNARLHWYWLNQLEASTSEFVSSSSAYESK